MYFSKFPDIYYDFEINGVTQLKILKDITVNVRVIKSAMEQITSYDEYDIVDGETPEQIAGKIYGNPLYHWVIMLTNDRYDYRKDFPLDYTALLKYAQDKYGTNNVHSAHHYVAPNGFIVNSFYPGATPVSNFQYEEVQNEAKRRIKLIAKPQLDAILKQFNTMFD